MILKIAVIFIMLGILFSLGVAGVGITQGGNKRGGTLIALKWRILLSVMLFFALFCAFSLGYIQPHGL